MNNYQMVKQPNILNKLNICRGFQTLGRWPLFPTVSMSLIPSDFYSEIKFGGNS